MLENLQPDFSTQLNCFFHDWVRLNQQKNEAVQEQLFFEQRLDLFFKEWRDLPPFKEIQEQSLFVDSIALERFFHNFNIAAEPIRAAKKQGFTLNVWKAAGLGTKEVRNSPVLKWFLDCRGDHGQGNAILLMLLKLLPTRFHQYQPDNYSAIDECCPLGNLENRVDIEIDADEFLLFIEIKINATEGQDQLQRYIDIAQAKAKNRDWLVVYLTRDGTLPESYLNHDSKNLVGMSWSTISKLLYQYAKLADVNNRGAWLAEQFADHIKTF